MRPLALAAGMLAMTALVACDNEDGMGTPFTPPATPEGTPTPGDTPTPTPADPGTPAPTPTPADPGTPAPTPTPAETPTPTTPGPGAIALDEQCDHPEAGYSIAYPAGWDANPGDVSPPCTFFEPEPFEVPGATELTTAINIHREPITVDEMLGGYEESEVHDQSERTVDGHDAIRAEIELERDLLHPAGTRITLTLVNLGEETLQLSTYDLEGYDYEQNREVLDAMIETLTID